MVRLKAAVVAVLLAASAGQGAADGMTQQAFDLSVSGIRVGTVGLAVETDGPRYAARGVLRGSGLFGRFVNLAFDGTARGFAQSNGVLVPQNYVSTRGKGDKTRRVEIAYERGTPSTVTLTPPRPAPRPYDLDPTTQTGTMDPITAAAALLPDRPSAQTCGRLITIFDGSRRSQIRLADPQPMQGGFSCAGVYERLAGYSPRSMEKQTRFDFVLRFREQDGIAQVTRIEMETTFGSAVAQRR